MQSHWALQRVFVLLSLLICWKQVKVAAQVPTSTNNNQTTTPSNTPVNATNGENSTLTIGGGGGGGNNTNQTSKNTTRYIPAQNLSAYFYPELKRLQLELGGGPQNKSYSTGQLTVAALAGIIVASLLLVIIILVMMKMMWQTKKRRRRGVFVENIPVTPPQAAYSPHRPPGRGMVRRPATPLDINLASPLDQVSSVAEEGGSGELKTVASGSPEVVPGPLRMSEEASSVYHPQVMTVGPDGSLTLASSSGGNSDSTSILHDATLSIDQSSQTSSILVIPVRSDST